jgi:hypothetical protein
MDYHSEHHLVPNTLPFTAPYKVAAASWRADQFKSTVRSDHFSLVDLSGIAAHQEVASPLLHHSRPWMLSAVIIIRQGGSRAE